MCFNATVKKYFDVCYLETFERWDFSREKEERPRGVEREIASCFFEINKSVIFGLEVNKSVVIFFGFGPVVLCDIFGGPTETKKLVM